MGKKFAIALLIGAFLTSFAMVGSAGAVSYSLQDLINTGSTGITIGDKTFYDFSYTGTSGAPTASQIQTQFIATPGDPGLSFTAPTGNGGTLWSLGTGGNMDSKISFYVQVNNPSAPINDISLMFGAQATGGGSVDVTENVYSGGTSVGGLYVNVDGYTQLNDSFGFTGGATYTNLFVTKDIALSTLFGGTAAITNVANQYSEVPVPATLLLFAPGLLGLVGVRKRLKG